MTDGYLFDLGKRSLQGCYPGVIAKIIRNGVCTDQSELTLDHSAKEEPCRAMG